MAAWCWPKEVLACGPTGSLEPVAPLDTSLGWGQGAGWHVRASRRVRVKEPGPRRLSRTTRGLCVVMMLEGWWTASLAGQLQRRGSFIAKTGSDTSWGLKSTPNQRQYFGEPKGTGTYWSLLPFQLTLPIMEKRAGIKSERWKLSKKEEGSKRKWSNKHNQTGTVASEQWVMSGGRPEGFYCGEFTERGFPFTSSRPASDLIVQTDSRTLPTPQPFHPL